MYNIMPKSHNGLNQSFLRDALGIALVRTWRQRQSSDHKQRNNRTHMIQFCEIEAPSVEN